MCIQILECALTECLIPPYLSVYLCVTGNMGAAHVCGVQRTALNVNSWAVAYLAIMSSEPLTGLLHSKQALLPWHSDYKCTPPPGFSCGFL